MTASAWRLPEPGSFEIRDHVRIPMADGTRLSARLWVPAAAPAPAVLEYIPYRKYDGTRGHDDVWGPALAGRGIAYARVDTRGTGDSEGVMVDEFSPGELDDGAAIVAWLAAQPWCTGAVGMRGLSWGGFNALQVAALRPPALKAILSCGTSDNRFTDDAHYTGGALARANFQWGLMMKRVMAGPPAPEVFGPDWEAEWRRRLEATPPILANWMAHARFDPYWRRGSVCVDYDAIACPTYVVGGWADFYVNAVSRLLGRLKVPRKGLVGPWGHAYPWASNVGLEWAFEEVRWWSHWLKGEATGIMDEPMLRVFMPYQTAAQAAPEPAAGRWIAEPVWPRAKQADRELWLNAGGLSDAAGAAGTVAVRGDRLVGLANPCQWWLGMPADQAEDDARSVVFDTAPLNEDLEILGTPVAHLAVSADRPVAHAAVRLCAVTPAGASWLVSCAVRNLTHRESHTDPTPLTPGERYEVALPMYFVAHRFAKGERIRVAVSASLWPLVWPAPEAASLTLAVGESRVALPVRPAEAKPARMPIPCKPAAPGAPRGAPADPGAPGCSITPGDPSSCHWADSGESRWTCAGEDCGVESAYDLTATPTHFRLVESLTARRGTTPVFARRAETTIPRDLL